MAQRHPTYQCSCPPLPAGASTAAKQPALGTGTASTDVYHRVRHCSMTHCCHTGSELMVNVAQINGVTPLWHGASGTGAQRVTIATIHRHLVRSHLSQRHHLTTLTVVESPMRCRSGNPIRFGLKAENLPRHYSRLMVIELLVC